MSESTKHEPETKLPLKSTVDIKIPAFKTNEKLQMWVLSHLGVQYSGSLSIHQYPINAFQILNTLPHGILSEVKSANEVYDNLRDMQSKRWIDYGTLQEDKFKTNFFLAAEGAFQFRKFISPVVRKVKDEKEYEEIIEKTEGEPELKQAFKDLRSKLKDKLEDEIINGIVALVKISGQQAVLFLVNLVMHGSTGHGAPIQFSDQ